MNHSSAGCLHPRFEESPSTKLPLLACRSPRASPGMRLAFLPKSRRVACSGSPPPTRCSPVVKVEPVGLLEVRAEAVDDTSIRWGFSQHRGVVHGLLARLDPEAHCGERTKTRLLGPLPEPDPSPTKSSSSAAPVLGPRAKDTAATRPACRSCPERGPAGTTRVIAGRQAGHDAPEQVCISSQLHV